MIALEERSLEKRLGSGLEAVIEILKSELDNSDFASFEIRQSRLSLVSPDSDPLYINLIVKYHSEAKDKNSRRWSYKIVENPKSGIWMRYGEFTKDLELNISESGMSFISEYKKDQIYLGLIGLVNILKEEFRNPTFRNFRIKQSRDGEDIRISLNVNYFGLDNESHKAKATYNCATESFEE